MLAEALIKFYQTANLVPVGVSLSCLEGWAARQAFALRRICQRFRKIFAESPTGAKNKDVLELKKRLLEHGMNMQPERQLSQEELEELPAAKVDWSALCAKVQAMKLRKKNVDPKEEGEQNKEELGNELLVVAKQEESSNRPVATPSRGKYALPPYVVKALQEGLSSAAEDEEKEEKNKAEQKAPKAKKAKGKAKSKPKAKSKATARKSKHDDGIGPEEEEHLKPLEVVGKGEGNLQLHENEMPAQAVQPVEPPMANELP